MRSTISSFPTHLYILAIRILELDLRPPTCDNIPDRVVRVEIIIHHFIDDMILSLIPEIPSDREHTF